MKSIFGLFENLTGYDLKKSDESKKAKSNLPDNTDIQEEIEKRKSELKAERNNQESYELEKNKY